ncbi:sulfotransferase [Nocardioides sp. MAHUQ-72]|uniref:sulfotransferase n=1 Tax=unclassified Nocardioides TaxID=2615069 RepID=UPI003616B595
MTRHLLVIGAQRCGTTWVHDLLAAHPDVAMARPARPEPKVFLSGTDAARGREWYVRTFFGHASGEQLLGEKSTSYLEYAEAADRAAAVLGDPLVLAVLRDPVRRAQSHWAFSTENGLEDRPLAEVLELNLAGPLAWTPGQTSVSPYAYLERGRYADYLAPWLERFRDDVTVAFLEELTTEEKARARLLERLGLDPARGATPGPAVNGTSQHAPELDPGLTARLRGYYQDSDRALVDLVGRALPWPTAD